MQVDVIVPPPVEPVTLAEVQAHLNISPVGSPATHPDDAKLTRLIRVARQWVEQYLGRYLIQQTLRIRLCAFPAGGMWRDPRGVSEMDREFGMGGRSSFRLSGGPVQSITQIGYWNNNNAAAVLDPSQYRLIQNNPSSVELVDGYSWPGTALRGDAVTVDYVVGYPTGGGSPATGYADNVPEPIREAILQHVQLHYDALAPKDREGQLQGIQMLLGMYRLNRFTGP